VTGAGAVDLVLIDDHAVLACDPAEALTCLDGPEAITAWFGARRSADQTTLHGPAGDLCLDRAHQQWRPQDGLLSVDGTIGALHFHAQLTVRAVIRPTPERPWRAATEIWVHVELGPASLADGPGAILRTVIHRGLDHLRWELDADTGQCS